MKLLLDYKEKVLAQLHESRRKNFDFEKPVYLAAAFYIQALRMKVSVDSTKLLSVATVNDKQFLKVKQSMLEVCFPSVLAREKERKERLKQTKNKRKLAKEQGVVVTLRPSTPNPPKDPISDETENDSSEEEEELQL